MDAAVLIDSSAIYALLDADDHRHEAASAWFAETLDTPLVTHAGMVIEATILLDRRLGSPATHGFLDAMLPTISVVHPSEHAYDRALAAFRAGTGRRRPSLVDCLSFETMRSNGMTTAFAFDQHFKDAGFTVVPDAGAQA